MGNISLPLLGFIIAAGGWVAREIWRWRNAKRQAALDASETLKDKKTLLEDMVSKAENPDVKSELLVQLDEVNTALLGLHSARLRRTLKAAGLPPEEALIADGLSQLQPQQVDELRGEIVELQTLPQSDSIWDMIALGNANYYAEQYEDAKSIYDRILELSPDDPIAFNNRGVTYDELGKYKEALADYNRSLELSPDDSGTLSNRGVTYRKMGKYKEALADYNRSLELSPDHLGTLNNRGVTYDELGKYEEALADYNRALELSPDRPDTFDNRGVTYTNMGKYKEAFADFNRALELRPDNPNTLYNLACFFSLQGKTDEAFSYLQKAIDKDKKYLKMVKTDEDFNTIREDPRFKKLIESE